MGIVKRLIAVVALTTCVFTASVYFTLFHHPPAAVILSNQQGQVLSADSFILDPSKPHSMSEIAKAAWGRWLYDNKYVSIGDLFDSNCSELHFSTTASMVRTCTYVYCVTSRVWSLAERHRHSMFDNIRDHQQVLDDL